MSQGNIDTNDYGDDEWDDDLGLRKVKSTDIAERRAALLLSGENIYEGDEDDEGRKKKHEMWHGSDDDDAQTVHTVASRTSIDENGNSSFDRATRVKLHQKYHRAVRRIECDKIRSWVNAVEATASYCPVQRQYYQHAYSRMPVQELRMRSVGVAAGSGFTIAVFDLEMGIILRKCKSASARCFALDHTVYGKRLRPKVPLTNHPHFYVPACLATVSHPPYNL